MEFSFYYDTVLWKTGLETGGQLGGKLQVMRILIGDNGKLVIDFKTHAKFRGKKSICVHTTTCTYCKYPNISNTLKTFTNNLLIIKRKCEGHN